MRIPRIAIVIGMVLIALGLTVGTIIAADQAAPMAVPKKVEPAPAPVIPPKPGITPAASASPATPAPPSVMAVGDKIAEISTQDMEGKSLSLDSLLKKDALNVLAFTNSACYACSSEAALLASLKGKHGKKINLIGVVVDISPNAYKSLPDDIKTNFSFVHDRRFKLTEQFGFDSTPSTALVKGGKIVDLKKGFRPEDSEAFVAYIEKNL